MRSGEQDGKTLSDSWAFPPGKTDEERYWNRPVVLAINRGAGLCLFPSCVNTGVRHSPFSCPQQPCTHDGCEFIREECAAHQCKRCGKYGHHDTVCHGDQATISGPGWLYPNTPHKNCGEYHWATSSSCKPENFSPIPREYQDVERAVKAEAGRMVEAKKSGKDYAPAVDLIALYSTLPSRIPPRRPPKLRAPPNNSRFPTPAPEPAPIASQFHLPTPSHRLSSKPAPHYEARLSPPGHAQLPASIGRPRNLLFVCEFQSSRRRTSLKADQAGWSEV